MQRPSFEGLKRAAASDEFRQAVGMIESTALAPAMPPAAAQGDWNSMPDQETTVDPCLRSLRAAGRVPQKSLPIAVAEDGICYPRPRDRASPPSADEPVVGGGREKPSSVNKAYDKTKASSCGVAPCHDR